MNDDPERDVLDGVPRVHFYEGGRRCPEDIILPSAMRAVLEYLGEKDYGVQALSGTEPGMQDPVHLCFSGGGIGRGRSPLLERGMARR